jgi:hypothetical protein
MKRWIIRTAAAVLLIVAAIGVWAAVTFINTTGIGGGSGLEQWVRGQLQDVAEQYLRPELELGEFDYQYPDIVVLHDVRLTAAGADGAPAVDILHVPRVRLQMHEVPRRGQPLRIRRVELEQPAFRFVAAERGGAAFIGWSNLLKDPASRPRPEADAEAKLSETFRIELVRVDNASIGYDPRSGDVGAPPMLLDGISTVLRVEPEQGNWYKVQFEFERPALMSAEADGRFDIDAFVLELASAQLRTTLDESAMSHLPPQLQSLIKQYELGGELIVSGSGTFKGDDLAASTAKGRMALNDASAAYKKTRLRVDRLEADLSLAQSVFDVPRFEAQLLRGALSGNGRVRFDEKREAQASVTLTGLRLEDTVRSLGGDAPRKGDAREGEAREGEAREGEAREGEAPAEPPASKNKDKANADPQYAGVLSGQITLTAPLDAGLEKTAGGGELHIRDGRLGGLPIISDLIAAVHGVTKVTPLGELTEPNDRADAKFRFENDRVRFEGIDIRTALMAARGNGTVGFDGTLDLLMNAGPLEKVQSLLGPVGDLIGKLTDQIAKYHVTGPASDPQVKLKLGPGQE